VGWGGVGGGEGVVGVGMGGERHRITMSCTHVGTPVDSLKGKDITMSFNIQYQLAITLIIINYRSTCVFTLFERFNVLSHLEISRRRLFNICLIVNLLTV
jgi:hypothetical protein